MSVAALAAAERSAQPLVRRIERLDPFVLVATLLLIGYGLVMTYSATFEDRTLGADASSFVLRGIVWAVLGLVAMAAAAWIDYRWLGAAAPAVYVAALAMLAAILVAGREVAGAQRALTVGGQNVQPSELAKILVVVVLAKYFADRRTTIGSPRTLLGGLILLGPPAFLVFRQPDLGTTLVFLAVFVGISFVAGARPWQLATLAGIAIAALPAAWTVLKDYQRARLTSFLDPYADPLGSGWNIIQSLIAVGSGGFT